MAHAGPGQNSCSDGNLAKKIHAPTAYANAPEYHAAPVPDGPARGVCRSAGLLNLRIKPTPSRSVGDLSHQRLSTLCVASQGPSITRVTDLLTGAPSKIMYSTGYGQIKSDMSAYDHICHAIKEEATSGYGDGDGRARNPKVTS